MSDFEPKAVTETDEYIGERIRARRNELGLPLAHVAEEIGIAYQQLQKYEAGQNRVSVSALMRIAEVLKVEASSFLPGAKPARRSASRAPEDGMALQLQRAFANIQSPQERRIILDLAKRFAASAPSPKQRAKKKKAPH